MRLAGIEINEADCRTLVDLLLRVGRADDLTAAAAIERSLAINATIVAPSIPDRSAILDVLDDPPDGGLVELRGELARGGDSASATGEPLFGAVLLPRSRRPSTSTLTTSRRYV